MSEGWFRIPKWCALADDTAEAVAAMWLLGRWDLGRDPSIAECKRAWGWGWDRCARFAGSLWTWAGEAGASRPATNPAERRDVGPLFDAEFEHPGPLTHADVVDRAVRWLRGHHNCLVVFAEINTYEKVNPDAIGFRKLAGASRGWSVLVEAKISRGDFRADREKIIHRLPDSCPGQERWYLTPPGLVRADEIPAGWGLAEVGKRSVRIVLPAPVGEPNMERHHADLGILLSALRRHQVGAGWRHEIAKFVPYDERMGAK